MFIVLLIEKFRDWLRYRETLRDLDGRSDRELEDFGFERAHLRSIARRSVKG